MRTKHHDWWSLANLVVSRKHFGWPHAQFATWVRAIVGWIAQLRNCHTRHVSPVGMFDNNNYIFISTTCMMYMYHLTAWIPHQAGRALRSRWCRPLWSHRRLSHGTESTPGRSRYQKAVDKLVIHSRTQLLASLSQELPAWISKPPCWVEHHYSSR